MTADVVNIADARTARQRRRDLVTFALAFGLLLVITWAGRHE